MFILFIIWQWFHKLSFFLCSLKKKRMQVYIFEKKKLKMNSFCWNNYVNITNWTLGFCKINFFFTWNIMVFWILQSFIKTKRTQTLFNFFSPVAFMEFMFHAVSAEYRKESFTWITLSKISSTYSIPLCIIMLTLDVIIYLLLSLYLEHVLPCKEIEMSLLTSRSIWIWSKPILFFIPFILEITFHLE